MRQMSPGPGIEPATAVSRTQGLQIVPYDSRLTGKGEGEKGRHAANVRLVRESNPRRPLRGLKASKCGLRYLLRHHTTPSHTYCDDLQSVKERNGTPPGLGMFFTWLQIGRFSRRSFGRPHTVALFPIKKPFYRGSSGSHAIMMQDSTTETVSNGPANQNGGANMDGILQEGTPKSATPLVDVTAADLLHLQQHQEVNHPTPLLCLMDMNSSAYELIRFVESIFPAEKSRSTGCIATTDKKSQEHHPKNCLTLLAGNEGGKTAACAFMSTCALPGRAWRPMPTLQLHVQACPGMSQLPLSLFLAEEKMITSWQWSAHAGLQYSDVCLGDDMCCFACKFFSDSPPSEPTESDSGAALKREAIILKSQAVLITLSPPSLRPRQTDLPILDNIVNA
ncbi:hypothetical protein CCH79_00019457 [Gambusia affinis]|uniref:Uncharacterized protein n=1 Tax=Gambusia affinis TaxID=33528 RepID=A0A315V016_GAMAF|nr:hypothetical protein CCH79_00019457 [Gambusia affinis]